MMKAIIYTDAAGNCCVCRPAEGARLVKRVRFANDEYTYDEPRTADSVQRKWPDPNVEVLEWAETEDEFVARIAAKDVPADATDVQIVDAASIPTDRTFRNGWKAGDGRVEHDLPKCKAIAHERRRAARAAEFSPLDVEATIPEKAAQAEAARQVVRDKYTAIQAAIDAAQSVEEIKATL